MLFLVTTLKTIIFLCTIRVLQECAKLKGTRTTWLIFADFGAKTLIMREFLREHGLQICYKYLLFWTITLMRILKQVIILQLREIYQCSTLHKICESAGCHWPVFSRGRTEYTIFCVEWFFMVYVNVDSWIVVTHLCIYSQGLNI